MKRLYLLLLNLALLCTYLVVIHYILKYYPIPHLTWDSFYYVKTSITHEYGIRPSGYAYFLDWTYSISKSIKAVVLVQAALHYIATILLLYTINEVLNIGKWLYFLLGLLLLLEPISLYHSNSILSDLLFAEMTIAALCCLVLYLKTQKFYLFLIHLILIFSCIEIRHIGLFYPFFTCGILILFTKRSRSLLLNISIILVIFASLYKWHVAENKKHYYVSVYSAFSGWTLANNALYALPYIHLNPSTISNKDIRGMHRFFTDYMDTTTFKVDRETVGSGFLWEDKSPLNVIRLKLIDSLHVDYNMSWYLCSPYFHYYGSYLIKHFPLAYWSGFIKPNTKSLLHPSIGEMKDYYITPFMDTITLSRYHLEEAEVKCKKQVYKDTINKYISSGYTVLLSIFGLSVILFLVFYRKFNKVFIKAIATIILFVSLFYAFTLYSSWFMFRYLLPVIPLMLVVIVMVWREMILTVVIKKQAISYY